MRNLITIIKGNTSGFTMMELVVTLALLGVLVSFAIPAYNGEFKVNKYEYDKPRYIPHIL